MRQNLKIYGQNDSYQGRMSLCIITDGVLAIPEMLSAKIAQWIRTNELLREQK